MKIMSIIVQNKENVIYEDMLRMVIIHCCSCSMPYAVPSNWQDQRIKDHKTFYCPNGHSQSYTEYALTEKERNLKLKLEESEVLLKQARDSEKFFIEQWQKRLDENKKLTRQIKRVHKGVCPCCNRSFINLQKHMKTKHPELTPPTK